MRIYPRLWASLLSVCSVAMPASGAPVIAVKLNPTSASLHVGETKTFTATVSNSSADTAVVWSVNGITGGNATVGTVVAGKYQAPAVVPAAGVVTVKAVSHADITKSDSAQVTLLNSVPAITTVAPAQINTMLAFTLTLTGTNFNSNASVKFDDATAVQTTFVSATQLTVKGKSASPAATQIHVTVTNPGVGATTSNLKTVTVQAPIVVTVSPKTKTLRGGTMLTLSARVTNNSDQTVTWSVNGVPGGSAAGGTIDSKGVYTAPVIIPGPSVTIAASSVQDPTKSDSAAITLQNPLPVITTVTSPIKSGVPISITITGTGFAKAGTVALGSVGLAVQWVSSTQLIATAASINPPVGGVLPLRVMNPDPGAASSNVYAVTVQNTGTQLSYQAARRFLEQATWGPTPASIAHLQSIGVDAWLAEQFALPPSQYAPPIDDTSGLDALQKEFFSNGMMGADQLRQRVAFALSQIVVVSGLKLPKYAQMMPYQQMLLNDAFSTYKQVLKDVTLSPAMGHYLDMVNNDKPSATNSPNENYAREFMQLFTIGLTQLNANGTTDTPPQPTFSEDDVKTMARVFTGWTYPQCLTASKWVNPPCWQGPTVAFEAHHDAANKTLFGVVFPGGTAETELNNALTAIESYTKPGSPVPNIAPFVALRLIQHLVTSNPSQAYVARIAGVYANSGGDLKQIVTAILKDTEAGFGNGGVDLPPTQGHLREPVFYVLSLLRALNGVYIYSPPLGSYTANMSQNLFNANSVFNYYSPFYHLAGTPYAAPEFQILNQSTAFARTNYAYRAVHNQLSSDIQVDLSNFRALASDTNPATQTASLTTLLNGVSQALLGGPLPPGMLTAILPALAATNDANTRALNAVYLVAASSEYQVQR